MSFFSEFVDGFVSSFTDAIQGADSSLIANLCGELGWTIDEVIDGRLILHFNDPQAIRGIRKVSIREGEGSLVRFFALSHTFLPSGRLPEQIAEYLLERNNGREIGSWGMFISDDGDACFCLQYVALKTGLDASALKLICNQLVPEVSKFDAEMRRVGLLR
jgi:hypothetical protein